MGERFELLEQLGKGGMGVVWQARDHDSGEIVALKLLHKVLVDDEDYVARFEREVDIASRIQSPNVVRTIGYGPQDGIPYMAMEYVEGSSLREYIKERGHVEWETARPILRQIASGLAAAHRAGIIHRDLKPSNVMITRDRVAKLADFGIARALDMTRLTGGATVLGTPHYMAPDTEASEASDLYAFGCIAYEMLTGVPPFSGDSSQQVMLRHIREEPKLTGLPPEPRALVASLLAKDRSERPRSAAAVAKALGNTRQAEPKVPRRRKLRRRRIVLVGLGTMLMAAAILAASGLFISRSPAAVEAAPVPSEIAIEASIIDGVNAARTAAGRLPLTLDPRLQSVGAPITTGVGSSTDCASVGTGYADRAAALGQAYAKATHWVSIVRCTSDLSGNDVVATLLGDGPNSRILDPELTLLGVTAAFEPAHPHASPRVVVAVDAIESVAPLWSAEGVGATVTSPSGFATTLSSVDFTSAERIRLDLNVQGTAAYTTLFYDRSGSTTLTDAHGVVYRPLDWSTTGSDTPDAVGETSFLAPGYPRRVWVSFAIPLTDQAELAYHDGDVDFELRVVSDGQPPGVSAAGVPQITDVELPTNPSPGTPITADIQLGDPEGDASGVTVQVVDATGSITSTTPVSITSPPDRQRIGLAFAAFTRECSNPASPVTLRLVAKDSLGNLSKAYEVAEPC